MRNIRYTTILPVLLMAVFITACGGGNDTASTDPMVTTPADPMADTRSDGDVRVVEVDLGNAIAANRSVVDDTDDFRPTDTVYASVYTNGTGTNVNLTARWIYEDGQVIDETTQTISPTGPTYTEFHISMADGLPTGDYTVEVLLNGERVESESFNVEM